MLMIGFTGERSVGKSTAAGILLRHGFRSVHAFGPGKAMCVTYYKHLGIDDETAQRMVYGDMKDTPHPDLPGGVDSRYFMERFGYFMGVTMGPQWTLSVELRHLRRTYPDAQGFVVESLVYEADTFQSDGGIIIRMIRDAGVKPIGEFTDDAQVKIKHDHVLDNNGDMNKLEQDLLKLVACIRTEERTDKFESWLKKAHPPAKTA